MIDLQLPIFSNFTGAQREGHQRISDLGHVVPVGLASTTLGVGHGAGDFLSELLAARNCTWDAAQVTQRPDTHTNKQTNKQTKHKNFQIPCSGSKVPNWQFLK